jgi:hypothetical protein
MMREVARRSTGGRRKFAATCNDAIFRQAVTMTTPANFGTSGKSGLLTRGSEFGRTVGNMEVGPAKQRLPSFEEAEPPRE